MHSFSSLEVYYTRGWRFLKICIPAESYTSGRANVAKCLLDGVKEKGGAGRTKVSSMMIASLVEMQRCSRAPAPRIVPC